MQNNITCYSNVSYIDRSDNVNRFYKDVRALTVMNNDLEKKYFNLYINGTSEEKKKAYDSIMKSNIRWVITISRTMAKNNDEFSDFISEGMIGLSRAIEKFIPSDKIKFITFATDYIRREINRYKVTGKKIVRQKSEPKIYSYKKNGIKVLENKLGREPTSEELIDYINNNSNNVKVNSSIDLISTKMAYIDNDVNDSEANNSLSTADTFYKDGLVSYNSYENNIDKDDKKSMIKRLMKTLNDTEKEVIKMIYGINCEKEYSTEEISEKIGVTSERIRQIKNYSILKMRRMSYNYCMA